MPAPAQLGGSGIGDVVRGPRFFYRKIGRTEGSMAYRAFGAQRANRVSLAAARTPNLSSLLALPSFCPSCEKSRAVRFGCRAGSLVSAGLGASAELFALASVLCEQGGAFELGFRFIEATEPFEQLSAGRGQQVVALKRRLVK